MDLLRIDHESESYFYHAHNNDSKPVINEACNSFNEALNGKKGMLNIQRVIGDTCNYFPNI